MDEKTAVEAHRWEGGAIDSRIFKTSAETYFSTSADVFFNVGGRVQYKAIHNYDYNYEMILLIAQSEKDLLAIVFCV